MVYPSISRRMSLKLRLCISCAQTLIQISSIWLIILLFRIPKSPNFEIQSVNTITPFTLNQIGNTPATPNTLSVGLNITFRIENPNHGTLYKEANVSVFYNFYQKHFPISGSSVHSFCPDYPTCDDSILNSSLPVIVKASSVPVRDSFTAFSMATDLEHGQVSLLIKVTADYRWYNHFLADLNATCNDINIGVPIGVMQGGSRPCNVIWSIVYLKTDLLFFLFPFSFVNILILLYWWFGWNFFIFYFIRPLFSL